MSRFQVLPIPASISAQVRSKLASPQYGHPAHAEVASGYGPCRSCLRTFAVGQDHRILFTYNPFEGVDDYPSPGPVFVHQEHCEPFREAGFPKDLRSLPLALEAYQQDRWIVDRARTTGTNIEDCIERLFARPEVLYIHVRNSEAGCFIAHIVRVPTEN